MTSNTAKGRASIVFTSEHPEPTRDAPATGSGEAHQHLDLPIGRDRSAGNEERRTPQRRLISLSMSGQREAAQRGVMMHKLPYGYRSHPEFKGVYAVDEPASAIVEEIFARFAAGASLHLIARDLSPRGVPSPAQASRQRGGDALSKARFWHTATVARIVRASIYIGVICWGRSKPLDDQAGADAVGRDLAVERAAAIGERKDLAIIPNDLWTKASRRLN